MFSLSGVPYRPRL